jgi:SpoIID/LytB domain protein
LLGLSVLYVARELPSAQAAPRGTTTAQPQEIYPVPPSGSYSFHGRGFGHGHGLSQWGAYGAAMVDHLSANQILHFYYPHTSLATRSTTQSIQVLLTAASAPTRGYVQVEPAAGLALTPVSGGDPVTLPTETAKGVVIDGWRLQQDGTTIELRERSNGHWHTDPTATGAGTFTDPAAKIVVDLPARAMTFRGAVIGEIEAHHMEAVNVVNVESYLRGVVPSEMPSTWSPAALQAQAVAARSYATRELRNPKTSWFDVFGDTRDQAYGGVGAETKATNEAVTATAGEVVVDHAGHAILAQYASSDGGWTVSGGVSYLPARKDPYDGAVPNAAHAWTTSVSAKSLAVAYPQIGQLQAIEITGRDGNGLWGGRVTSLTLQGDGGTASLSGTDLQFTLGLRSPWFRPVPLPAAPSKLTASFDHKVLTASWQPPDSIRGAAAPTSYRVSVTPGNHQATVPATAQTVSVDDLPPGTYTVTVVAESDAGPGPAASVVVKTGHQ